MKQSTPIGSHVFNLRLFIEGLKRLRVTTMAMGIITVAFSALIPIISMLESSPRYTAFGEVIITEIKFQTICVPASLAVVLAPLFFAVLFSFLEKRKQSDFFHAIPYTRTCVYISFVAAALVSVCAIQLLAGLVAGLLWSMVPYTTFEVAPYIGVVFANLLGSVMLSAFMMLALCVSGTGGSCSVLFLLFAALPRVILAIIMSFIRMIPVLDIDYWIEESFLSPLWFYPLASLSACISDTETIEHFLFNPTTIVYSAVVSVLLFLAAGFLYARRQSEMAGNPAPGKKTQALFRILFTLPVALWMTGLIADNGESSLVLVLLVITVLCYFLYELITTKRAVNMAKAIPGFFLVVGICILFAVTAYYAPLSYVQAESLTTENVASITVPKRLVTDNGYGGYYETVEVRDPEIVKILTNAYTRTKQNGVNQYGYSYVFIIEHKSGRELHRRINITQAERTEISNLYFSDENNQNDAIYQPEEVHSMNVEACFANGRAFSLFYTVADDNLSPLLQLLLNEINALAPADRHLVLNSSDEYGVRLTLYTPDVATDCFVNELLPKTRRYLYGMFTDVSRNMLYINDQMSPDALSAEEIIERSIEFLMTDGTADDLTVDLMAQPLASPKSNSIADTFKLDSEKLAALLTFLEEHLIVVDRSTEDILVPGDGYELWYLRTEYTLASGKASLHMALAMNKDDTQAFRKLLYP